MEFLFNNYFDIDLLGYYGQNKKSLDNRNEIIAVIVFHSVGICVVNNSDGADDVEQSVDVTRHSPTQVLKNLSIP
ncbi:hypothetical protein L1987_76129 [Smallanthus sonchifolius]|uniref:Uncharacterized protein n=1 Tax=Smallanthus sonchifolius TaxID=185202 RepID=A0ACB9ABR8_9ASTR|nr:hypothetical protein L1987_76129 [Smallanthus sonchifolius]